MCTRIENFSSELFYMIFDYLCNEDISFAFSGLNLRLNRIVSKMNKPHFSFTKYSSTKFHNFWINYMPLIKHKVVALEFLGRQIDLKDILFTGFNCLTSLVLEDINCRQAEYVITENLSKLKRLSIRGLFADYYQNKNVMIASLLQLIFHHLSNLQDLIILPADNEKLVYDEQTILSTKNRLKTLTIHLHYINNLFSILQYLPYIEHVNFTFSSYYRMSVFQTMYLIPTLTILNIHSVMNPCFDLVKYLFKCCPNLREFTNNGIQMTACN
ncbi:unnamed protein product [Didymodactylos carnosus]|uniref:Uncharacterized protein n=1 Tax=Didymodactylos carnosus TaxID=1234261 RepID=A0A8S2WNL3_9BILA|nr:unnamed protein product [Didymodactylos carnosus]